MHNKINTQPTSNIYEEIHFYLFSLLAISLPLFEAPKNIICLLILLNFLFITCQKIKNKEHEISAIQKSILIYFIGSLAASALALLNGYESDKIIDIFRYSTLGYILLSIKLSNKKINILFLLLVISCTLSIAHGFYMIEENSLYLQLKSVGHVNHSGTYILICSCLFIYFLTYSASNWVKIISFIFLILFIYTIMESGSRATFIGLIISFTTFIYIYAKTNRFTKKHYIIVASITAILVITAITIPKTLNKFQAHISQIQKTGTIDKIPRVGLVKTSIKIWQTSPVFGIGYGNYAEFDRNNLSKIYPDTTFDHTYYFSSHAHNRYLNTLAEGGIIGLASLLIMLGYLFYYWLKKIPTSATAANRPYLAHWLLGFNVLLIVSIIGLFNTTLHHEHGILSMMLIALSYLGMENASRSTQADTQ